MLSLSLIKYPRLFISIGFLVTLIYLLIVYFMRTNISHLEDGWKMNKKTLGMYECVNNSDCWRLSHLISGHWPEDKPKAAIYILVRNDPHDLQVLLSELDKYFNDFYHYPVIIFHESRFRGYKQTVKQSTHSSVYFQEVQFEIPAFIKYVPLTTTCSRHNVGYRHMCRFQAKTIYELPIMKYLDYYMRLDTDSHLLKNFTYDIFQFMKTKRYLYGYQCTMHDVSRCVLNLKETAESFVLKENLTTYFMSKLRKNTIFYNNFEVGAMSLFRKKLYKKYIDWIDHNGGIYKHRWGDAPIKSLAVAILAPENRTHQFYDIGYSHQGLWNPASDKTFIPQGWKCDILTNHYKRRQYRRKPIVT